MTPATTATDPDETDLEPTTPVTPAATRYFAVKETNDFTAADFLAGEEFDEDGRVVIPPYPAGVFRAYYGIAIEHGKTLTQVIFDPDASAQLTTTQYTQAADVVVAGEPYSPWSAGRYFNVTEGFVIQITVEDV